MTLRLLLTSSWGVSLHFGPLHWMDGGFFVKSSQVKSIWRACWLLSYYHRWLTIHYVWRKRDLANRRYGPPWIDVMRINFGIISAREEKISPFSYYLCLHKKIERARFPAKRKKTPPPRPSKTEEITCCVVYIFLYFCVCIYLRRNNKYVNSKRGNSAAI